MITRVVCAVVITIGLMLALICAHLWFQDDVGLASVTGAAAVAAIAAGRRFARRNQSIAFHGSAIGALLGFVLTAYLLPYRSTAARLSLTPETAAAEVVFDSLYFVASLAGAYAGSYLPILRSRAMLKIDDGSL